MTPLSKYHRHMLGTASAISDEVIAARGYYTVSRDSADSTGSRDLLKGFGIPRWARSSDTQYPGLLIPMYQPTGERASVQYRPDKSVKDPETGKYRKYAAAVGKASVLDVHPHNTRRIVDPAVPLWITEGVKKADSLTTAGQCVVALSGVFNWRSSHGTLGAWEDVLIKGREVIICFDADAQSNLNVLRAMLRLGRWLKSKDAGKVRYLIVPSDVNGTAVKGADDYLAAGGNLGGLLAAATTTEPDPNRGDDTFSDARMAETIADDVLAGKFCWVKGLGWLMWEGRRWVECSDKAVVEEVRQYVLDRFADSAQAMRGGNGNSAGLDGWRSMLAASRIHSVLGLSAGRAERASKDFDADPDLLNTPGGVVDLRTGEILEHDPELLMTRITSGRYRPGFTHPDWDIALEALPLTERTWYQSRIGQGITGRPTPDGIMPLLQGSGENGKSLLTTDGAVPALGDYADVASPKLVSSEKGSEHSTERADLRGRRLLIGEELTEGRSIDVTALKRIQDLTLIKARYVHKNNITFDASHSLFVTTNYVPVVNETDHGTWRRLALLRFPYTFRKLKADVVRDTDRLGDPGVKRRIRDNHDQQHDAIVTWAVEGAIRWNANPDTSLALTEGITKDTQWWRAEADRVMGFWLERIVADRAACIVADEMLGAFNEWLISNGHNKWSRELFAPRFEQHHESQKHGVSKARVRANQMENPSRWAAPGVLPGPLPSRAETWFGIRFRTEADDANDDHVRDADRPKREPWPEWPESSGNTPIRGRSEFFPENYGHSGQTTTTDPSEDPQRCDCGEPLCAPASRQRGYCERCRLARQEAS